MIDLRTRFFKQKENKKLESNRLIQKGRELEKIKMEKKLNKRIDDILNSTKGSQRAKPSTNLYVRIEQQLQPVETINLSSIQIRLSAAAALLILCLNVWAIQHYLYEGKKGEVGYEPHSQALISNYKLYD